MKLYTFFRSSTSYRLRIALAWKKLAYEPVYTSLPGMKHKDPAYLKLNPQGLVPALVSDAGKVYTQSMAMIEWLDERYPDPPLVPRDAEEKWYVRAVSQIIGCEMHPLNNVRVLKYLKCAYGLDDANVNGDWYPHWVAEGFAGSGRFSDPAEIEPQLLPGRSRHHGRRVPGAAGVQRSTLQLRPRALSDVDGDLRSLHEAGGVLRDAALQTGRRRMTLPRQSYFDYSAIVDRPQFEWPDRKRLAFHLCLNLEAFAYNSGLGISYSPGLPHPNSYNWGWREYGNRVGVWRLSSFSTSSSSRCRCSSTASATSTARR